jgi:thiol-disulfide isomerase/thioredoxin
MQEAKGRGVAGRVEIRAGIGMVALVACVALVLTAGGCATNQMKSISDRADFQQKVLRSDKPVLVDFYKGGGCPTCVLLNPTLTQLADEYKGRVQFTSFEAMTPFFQVTSQTLKDRYDIQYFPTVVLFVNGREKQRWILDYNIDNYRNALDQVTRAPAAGATAKANSVYVTP